MKDAGGNKIKLQEGDLVIINISEKNKSRGWVSIYRNFNASPLYWENGDNKLLIKDFLSTVQLIQGILGCKLQLIDSKETKQIYKII